MEMLLHKPAKGSGWGRPRATALLALLACAILLIVPSQACAQGNDEAEYRVKLAFLYNFTQFVQWPPEAFSSPGSTLTICVAGQDPFKGEIEQSLRGRTAGGHPIQIRKLKPDDEVKTCQILFVRSSEMKTAVKLISGLKGSSTLTIGETAGFAAQGGLINLIRDQNKLHFEVNLGAAAQTHLKISSKLLALARIVNGG